jgi:flagellar FliJ protein
MKRFHFSLEALLDLRKRKEESIKLELAEKQRSIHEAGACMEELRLELTSMQQQQKSSRAHSSDIMAMRQTVSYRNSLKLSMLRTGQKIQTLRGEAEAIRQRLMRATQQRRMLEMMRERKEKQWRKEYLAQEQRFADDVSQQRYIRERRKHGQAAAGEA